MSATLRKKLLLVDDETDFLTATARFFVRRGIDCDTAASCGDAMLQLNRQRYDAVVMDMLMPGLCGLECMKELQKLQPGLPIIILTGHASVNASMMGIKSGALDYCLKPIELTELFEKVQLAIQASQD